MKNRKTSLNILIDFFASLYDFVIDLFASIYDFVFGFVVFLWEYLKWITDIGTTKSNDFNTHVKEPIKVHYQNPFDI